MAQGKDPVMQVMEAGSLNFSSDLRIRPPQLTQLPPRNHAVLLTGQLRYPPSCLFPPHTE